MIIKILFFVALLLAGGLKVFYTMLYLDGLLLLFLFNTPSVCVAHYIIALLCRLYL